MPGRSPYHASSAAERLSPYRPQTTSFPRSPVGMHTRQPVWLFELSCTSLILSQTRQGILASFLAEQRV